MKRSLRTLLVALLTASALIGGAPAPARATGPTVVLARAGIGTSHFGGGGRGISRPGFGSRRRGFGHGFFFFGGGGLGFLPTLLLVLLIVALVRSSRNRR